MKVPARTSALRTLCKRAVLFHAERGEYAFVDENLRRWIRESGMR